MYRLYSVCLLFFAAGIARAQATYFPVYPWALASLDARTLSLGDASLFSAGPPATYGNPGNLGTTQTFAFGVAGEWRDTLEGSYVSEEDVFYLPLTAGIVIPRILKGSLGLTYFNLMKRYERDEDSLPSGPYVYEDKAALSLICLGYRRTILPRMELGAAVNFTWGNHAMNMQSPELPNMVWESSACGVSALISNSVSVNEHVRCALRIQSPTVLWVDGVRTESLELAVEAETLSFRESILWAIDAGMEYRISPPAVLVVQATYRDWDRSWSWADHEIQLKGGLEILALEHIAFRGGGQLQWFYDEQEFPASMLRVMFLNCGLGLRIGRASLDVGLGKSVLVDHAYPGWVFYPRRFSIAMDVHVFLEKPVR